MKIFAPKYYKEFKCIADKCKNSCCIGWEIDIDEATLDRYMKVEGIFGERLKKCISVADGDCHFVLESDEKCPFLNDSNLCDIYTELGEDALCNICADHPRFRNFYDSRIEMGLGLCCEAVCDLILDREKPFELVIVDETQEDECFDETEDVIFALRNKAFEIICDESVSAEESAAKLVEVFCKYMPEKIYEEWIDIFLKLEILDERWKTILEEAKKCKSANFDIFKSPKGQNAQRQLLLYFIYRHGADGMYDGSFGARLAFAVLSLNMIKFLCAADKNADFDTLKDIARRYSAEIEYCEENVEALIAELLP